MKGVIFNLLEEVVCEELGDESWESLLAITNISGAYTSLGSYDDSEMLALVNAAAAVTSQQPSEILRWFGNKAIPKLANRYPEFFDGVPTARDFILSVNTIIHPEVRKLYSGAGCPHFHFSTAGNELLVGYQSARKLCDLAHGFIEGVAAYYHSPTVIRHQSCMNDGDAVCQLAVSWPQ
jgi:hypothetical protein